MLLKVARFAPPLLVLFAASACSSDDDPLAPQPEDQGPQGCQLQDLEPGDPDGHPEPTGAKAAGQARAGRITDAAQVVPPPFARQLVNVGDYLLINEQVAVYIEDKGMSDGYARFGGEILGIDKVGDDGRPIGASGYGETMMGLSNEMIDPSSVTVLNDGSDGGAAIVRVLGQLKPIPFLGESALGSLFPRAYGLPAAYDYVLEPGSSKLTIRLNLINRGEEALDFSLDEMYGFFHYARTSMLTPEKGYATPGNRAQWVGFDSGEVAFAWRTPSDALWFALQQSGFSYFQGVGFQADACSIVERDHAEIITGGPELEGLLEAIRRTDSDATWHPVSGTVRDAWSTPVADAWVHLVGADGVYLNRTRTAADGTFKLHAPASTVKVVPQLQGFPQHEGKSLTASESTAELTFAEHGFIHIRAHEDATTKQLPVRIQVIPSEAQAATPNSFGVPDERNGRLYQHFAPTGEATLRVPVGEHRVIVSRGYEWEIHDTTVQVDPKATAEVVAPLVHSVDTSGWMCADFHVHSFFSADSSDSIEFKVAGTVADGLDIVVSSDHEWVVDPHVIVQSMGLTDWAFGFPSLELTTFTWGHFGIIPLMPHAHLPNNGAIDWIGKTPAEVFKDVDDHPEKPLVIVNHPRSDSFGGYFNAAGYKRDTGKGNQLWSDNFDVVEVMNGSDFQANENDSVADWYSFLEQGRDVWAVGSSDNHHLRGGPVGYPRTCMFFGHDDPKKLTVPAVRDALASGAAVVSGGVFLTVLGPTGERPGQTAMVSGNSATISVTVQAPSWVPVQSLQTIVNGQVFATQDLTESVGTGPAKRFEVQVEVPVDSTRPRTWVIFHVRGGADLSPVHLGERSFAVSNPVFLKAQ